MRRPNATSMLILLLGASSVSCGLEATGDRVTHNGRDYALYPKTLKTQPDIPSPFEAEDGTEVLLVKAKGDRYALIPVTVENGAPLHYSKRVESVHGKDAQLYIAKGDFPELAETGLHSEAALDEKETITGHPISVINSIAKPGGFSSIGFMADDEDVISVLKGDNRLAEKLGLTHPELAKPLFHVWNVVLKELELGNWPRHWDRIPILFYNGREVALEAVRSKGWQISIFQDEIQGSFDLYVRSDLTSTERAFLQEKYHHLSDARMAELTEKLSRIHFSEMAPYYIMRYGFYEGHTDYRADPIAISFVFGLRSLEEIEERFPGGLYDALTTHFTETSLGGQPDWLSERMDGGSA